MLKVGKKLYEYSVNFAEILKIVEKIGKKLELIMNKIYVNFTKKGIEILYLLFGKF